MNCIIANTSVRNCAIGDKSGGAQCFCVSTNRPITAAQSYSPRDGRSAATSLLNAATGPADASNPEFSFLGRWRICALCNEHTFTIGQTDSNNIGAPNLIAPEVLP